MELIIAAIAVFLCPIFFIIGVLAGKKLREVRTVERVVENGITTQKSVETFPAPKQKPEEKSDEVTPEKARENWLNYGTQYSGVNK